MDGLATWATWAMLVIVTCGFGGTIWSILSHRETLRTLNTIMLFERFSRFEVAAPPELTEDGAHWLAKLTPKKRQQVLASARSYFSLCSDEYALGTNNRIDLDLWQKWLDGAKTRMAQPIWQDCWSELETNYRAQTDFWDFMGMGKFEFISTSKTA